MANIDIGKTLRSAGMPTTNEIIEMRSDGIEDYLGGSLSDDTIIELVKLFYTGQCDKGVFEEFVEAFHSYDCNFADDLHNEIKILAGLVLSRIIEIDKEYYQIILLEIYAQVYEFLGYTSNCTEITNAIHIDFNRRRSEKRENITFSATNLSKVEDSVKFEETEESEENTYVYNDIVANNLDIIVDKVNEVINRLNQFDHSEQEKLSILYEDSQMLWWLLTGISDDYNKKYSEIDIKNSAILAAKDLAQRVKIYPGPFAAESLLKKVFDYVKKNKDIYLFDEYIDAVDDNVITSLLDEEIPYDTPILYALKKKEENGSGNWKTAFLKKFQLKKQDFTVFEIAYETYLECLLLYNS